MTCVQFKTCAHSKPLELRNSLHTVLENIGNTDPYHSIIPRSTAQQLKKVKLNVTTEHLQYILL